MRVVAWKLALMKLMGLQWQWEGVWWESMLSSLCFVYGLACVSMCVQMYCMWKYSTVGPLNWSMTLCLGLLNVQCLQPSNVQYNLDWDTMVPLSLASICAEWSLMVCGNFPLQPNSIYTIDRHYTNICNTVDRTPRITSNLDPFYYEFLIQWFYNCKTFLELRKAI